tara:strand:+ start:392 stop:2635 length:2244 start_codon:yes stop_codon:yes gene_type:complete
MNNTKIAKCIRKISNFSMQKKMDKIDKDGFKIDNLRDNLEKISPKMIELINNIEKLDKEDMKKYKRKFKHVIYTDVKESSSGAKMIAASLLTKGYKNVYNKNLKMEEYTKENKNKNIALLCSVQIYNKPFPIKLKKSIISKFNERPDNINGEKIRIIIIDSGYKEGIDLFDVKYLHIFEPLMTKSEEKQVIGRGTRYCGQKGLKFEPNLGWQLHVYKYNLLTENVKILEKKGIDLKKEKINVQELLILLNNIDLTKVSFASELEKITKYGSIDYELTKSIHNISIQDSLSKLKKGGGIKGKRKKGINKNLEKAPNRLLNFEEMRKYIKERYQKYKWEKIVIKNNCVEDNKEKEIKFKSFGGKEIKSLPIPEKGLPPSLPRKDERLIKLTPTQDFISNFYDYKSIYKGLLLWHSVGTGKTCTAIATATRGFDEHNYTIIWVTRHTLKSDIWKNMYQQSCSSIIRRKIINGENIPKNINKNYMKYLSKNWIMPMSYKQFSNMLLKKNKFYNILEKKNGKEDILKRTLIIIDEVHKLYSNDIVISEKPNIEVINKRIKESYKISGKDSVKLLLMSATPYTSDIMQLIKIINLMKEEKDEIPEKYEDFSEEYLDNGKFTEKGKEKYLNEISGYISYLNREKDVRNFAYPVYYDIDVDMSKPNKEIIDLRDNIVKSENEIKEEEEYIENNKIEINENKKDKENVKKLREEIKKIKENIKENKKELKKYKRDEKKLSENDNSQYTAMDKCFIK